MSMPLLAVGSIGWTEGGKIWLLSLYPRLRLQCIACSCGVNRYSLLQGFRTEINIHSADLVHDWLNLFLHPRETMPKMQTFQSSAFKLMPFFFFLRNRMFTLNG